MTGRKIFCFILDSEWSDRCINFSNFTMMCVCVFIFLRRSSPFRVVKLLKFSTLGIVTGSKSDLVGVLLLFCLGGGSK